MSEKLKNDTLKEFAKKIESMRQKLNSQRQLAQEGSEEVPNLERSVVSNNLRSECDAAWKKMAQYGHDLRERKGYDNMETAMQQIAEFCLLIAKCLSLELSCHSSQFFSEPNSRKTKSIAENPKSLQDFVKIGDDGKLDVSGLEQLANPQSEQEKENLRIVTTNWLETLGFTKEDDGSFKKDSQVALRNNSLKFLPEGLGLAGLDDYLAQLVENDFEPAQAAAGAGAPRP